eukprot:2707448-Amphidinium_carterae.1
MATNYVLAPRWADLMEEEEETRSQRTSMLVLEAACQTSQEVWALYGLTLADLDWLQSGVE